jgi:putative ABC transport system permease protein
VTAGYFELLGMPVTVGRGIGERDVEGAVQAAVVNEAFARRYWGDQSPLGRTFDIVGSGIFDSRTGLGHEGRYEVVGVTPGVSWDPSSPTRPAFWTALAQLDRVDEVILHARSAGDVGIAVRVLREELRAHDVVSNLFSPQPYRTVIDAGFAGSRAASRLLGWASVFTLLLASAGVFGIVSYSVTRRIPEMAVRRALGARGGQVVRVLVRDAMTVVGVGALLGLGIVGLLAPLARGLLYGLAPLDPLALTGATVVLAVAALVASWLPARRMARVDPVGALKGE